MGTHQDHPAEFIEVATGHVAAIFVGMLAAWTLAAQLCPTTEVVLRNETWGCLFGAWRIAPKQPKTRFRLLQLQF
jgi:hypothetical protein